MTAQPAMSEIRSDTFAVGDYGCTLIVTVNDAGKPTDLRVEWEPHRPGRLGAAELAAYRAARNAFLEQVAAQTGGGIAVVDL